MQRFCMSPPTWLWLLLIIRYICSIMQLQHYSFFKSPVHLDTNTYHQKSCTQFSPRGCKASMQCRLSDSMRIFVTWSELHERCLIFRPITSFGHMVITAVSASRLHETFPAEIHTAVDNFQVLGFAKLSGDTKHLRLLYDVTVVDIEPSCSNPANDLLIVGRQILCA